MRSRGYPERSILKFVPRELGSFENQTARDAQRVEPVPKGWLARSTTRRSLSAFPSLTPKAGPRQGGSRDHLPTGHLH
jgi:hypothetical protein